MIFFFLLVFLVHLAHNYLFIKIIYSKFGILHTCIEWNTHLFTANLTKNLNQTETGIKSIET